MAGRQPPTWIQAPPDAVPAPPTVTRAQTLPFGELTWENFERLCYRLVESEANIEVCNLYGRRGQKQHGIDIYAKSTATNTYVVYQCKDVETLTASSVKAAVTDFLANEWATKATQFVFCTTQQTRDTAIQDELERQRDLLGTSNIGFAVWDEESLSIKLKTRAEVVDDFFGRAWVERFIGKEVSAGLRTRLDGESIAALRSRLQHFYEIVFTEADPGRILAGHEPASSFPLLERYIVPDLLSDERIDGQRPSRASVPMLAGPSATTPTEGGHPANSGGIHSTSAELRESLSRWLLTTTRAVVVGDAGTGKSSLLRHVALELLSNDPQLGDAGANWAQRIPVWVPFAFWTKLIDKSESDASLEACLQKWFAVHSAENFWPLIKAAIDDERLLLLVDGLDEWTSIAAARIAWRLLHVFGSTKNVGIIATSRPYGLEALRSDGLPWRVSRMAPLSPAQRRELSHKWFRKSLDADPHNVSTDEEKQITADRRTDQFILEIDASNDLQRLAETPLLLLFLIAVRMQNGTLPRRRFDAYAQIVSHLIASRPAARLVTATVLSHDELADGIDIEAALAFLAYHAQSEQTDGLLSLDDVRTTMTRYLYDNVLGEGSTLIEAQRLSDRFIDHARRVLGILITESDERVAFAHRSFQEFLAARHLSRFSLDDLIDVVGERCRDVLWHDVLLALCWHIGRPDELDRVLDRMTIEAGQDDIGLRLMELQFEIAFGDFKLSSTAAEKLYSEAVSRIETHPWMPHRQRVLGHMLEGLRAIRFRERIVVKLRSWMFLRSGWRQGWYNGMHNWPATDETVNALLRAIHSDDDGVQRRSAMALAAVAKGRLDVGDRLGHLALYDQQPRVRAAALESLHAGWPGHTALDVALPGARISAAPELRLVAYSIRIAAGTQDDDDYRQLLTLSENHSRYEVASAWQSLIAENLISGWKGDPRLLKVCLDAVTASLEHRELDNQIAFRVLLCAFPQDRTVAETIASELKNANYPFVGLHTRADGYDLLLHNFRDNPTVIEALDARPPESHSAPELAYASLVGRTPAMKTRLLAALPASSPFWPADALLEGWGLDDAEARAALTALAYEAPRRASEIAHLIPRILPAPEAEKRLKELLFATAPRRIEAIISGIGLTALANDPEVAEQALQLVREGERNAFDMHAAALFRVFHAQTTVRAFALEYVEHFSAPLESVAEAYHKDPELRTAVIAATGGLPQPLRLHIVTTLAKRREDARDVALLANYTLEDDGDVRTVSATAFWSSIADNAEQVTSNISRLITDVTSYGFDLETRRAAAFAGLIQLRRLDVLEGLHETIGTPSPLRLSLGEHGRPNLPLIRTIAENWTYVSTSVPDLVDHFERDERYRFWPLMSVVAAEFPEVNAAVSEAIEANADVAMHPNCLRYLARMQPRSVALQERCIAAMNLGMRGDPDSPHTGAKLLAEHFGGNEATLELLMKPPETWEQSVAICLGWPQSDAARALYEKMIGSRPPVPYWVFFNIIYSGVPAHELVARLKYDLTRQKAFAFSSIGEALEQRVRWDPLAGEALAAEYRATATSTAKASIARLVASAGRLTEILRDLLRATVSTEMTAGKSPDAAFDILSAEVRSLAVTHLDALTGERGDYL